MKPKFFEANDPKIASEDATAFFNKNFQVVAIEDLGPDSYYIMQANNDFKFSTDLQIIVRHKNLAREIFTNYTEALELIQRVKDSVYDN